ncbi:MAG: cobalamin biosynthesis protein, partial [Muribaculaceae bacterium]|nr:cobalamin biosynthesis protein [Muribaculaceae bacterium]
MDAIIACLPLMIGWTLDLMAGDPAWLPHPVVWFGKAIAWCEHRFNKGACRRFKGAVCAILLIVGAFLLTAWFLSAIENAWINVSVQAILIFYCLAGTTLVREVRQVFIAVDESLDKGRVQVGRIVGRDTSALSAQEIRTAALETLAENLSDGVIAPLFWYAVLGVPGMVAYKMVNTLDSMIGYRNERYR